MAIFERCRRSCMAIICMDDPESPTNRDTMRLDSSKYVECTHPQYLALLDPQLSLQNPSFEGGGADGAPATFSMLRDMMHEQRDGGEVVAHIVRDFQQVDLSHLHIDHHEHIGKGATGRVDLCTCRSGSRADLIALKELAMPERYRFKDRNLADVLKLLPFEEAAYQALGKHINIVEIYWADVSVIDFATMAPIPLEPRQFRGASRANGNAGERRLLTLMQLMEGGDALSGYDLPEAVGLNMRIAMEFCNLGALFKHLKSRNSAETPVPINALTGSMDMTLCAALTALDIARGLTLLHKLKIVHGDIKPHNILLSSAPESKRDPRGFIAKLSDFGMSVMVSSSSAAAVVKQGSVEYMPYDAFEDCCVSRSTDIYALGIVMWEIWHNEVWEERYRAELNQQRFGKIDMRNYVPRCGPSCPPAFAEIVHQCLAAEVAKRPSAKEVARNLETLAETYRSQPFQ